MARHSDADHPGPAAPREPDPQRSRTPHLPEDAGPPGAPGGSYLLCRYAEALFWLARYMERIENLARILDVTDTFTRSGSDSGAWRSIVQINSDERGFDAKHSAATAATVTEFYVLDRSNPNSIAASIFQARENARTLRPLISTEMWSQINVFYNRVRQLGPDDLAASRLSGLCAWLKEACQLHAGITEGTFFRDQGWAFYSIGKYMERGDQTTRLLDIKYHTLLPSIQDVGSPVDLSQWNSVLRAAAGYHAFRRVYPRGISAGSVAGFLLLNRSFARSLALCAWLMHWHLAQLRAGYGLRRAAVPLERLDGLRSALLERDIAEIIGSGLHEFLDWVQRDLSLLYQDIAVSFWEQAPPEPDAPPT